MSKLMVFLTVFCFWLPARIGHLWTEEEIQESNTWPTTCLRGLMVGSFNGKPYSRKTFWALANNTV